MTQTVIEIKTLGNATLDTERAIVSALEDALSALDAVGDIEDDAPAFDRVEGTMNTLRDAQDYDPMAEMPEDRTHPDTVAQWARDAVNELIEQWGNLTRGAQCARVESAGPYALRVVLDTP